jgi:hypothetical protein
MVNNPIEATTFLHCIQTSFLKTEFVETKRPVFRSGSIQLELFSKPPFEQLRRPSRTTGLGTTELRGPANGPKKRLMSAATQGEVGLQVRDFRNDLLNLGMLQSIRAANKSAIEACRESRRYRCV